MIKVKLSELSGILNGFEGLMGMELPVKPAYWAGKNMKKIVAVFQEFDKNRVALAEKYANKDGDGRAIINENQYDMADQAAFDKEFADLQNIEEEFDIPPLKLSQLGEISIKPAIIFGLGPFIEDDTE